MRITKKMLLETIEASKRFARCDIVLVSRSNADKLRASTGFIDLCQYGRGQFASNNEVGRIGNRRFIAGNLPRWQP